MVAVFVRALATVLLMGRVAVLYRYRAVLVTLLCAQGRRPASPTVLCTRGRRPACRRGTLPPPSGTAVAACCTVATPPTPASFPPLRPCWQSVWLCTYKIAGTKRSRRLPVGVAGFEPTASSSRTKRATKLRHTPVPFEYSLTSPIFPNGDQASIVSVFHAALNFLGDSRVAKDRRGATGAARRDTRGGATPRGASRCAPWRTGMCPDPRTHAATPPSHPVHASASDPLRRGVKCRNS